MSDEQLLSIPLGGGLDETFDDLFVPPERMRKAQNVVFPDVNTCVKRPGVNALATLANLKRLVRRGDEVLAIDGLNAWSWSPTAKALVNRGAVPPCIVRQLPLGGSSPINLTTANQADNYYLPPNGGLTEANGFRVAVWTDQVSIFASVYDVAGKCFVRAQETLNASGHQTPRIFAIGTTAFALYYLQAAGHIVARTLDLTNVTSGWTAEVTLTTNTATLSAVFDATPVTGSTNFALVHSTPALTQVNAYVFSAALATVAGPVNVLSASVDCLTVRSTTADNIFTWAVGYRPAGVNTVTAGSLTANLGSVIQAPTVVSTPTGNANLGISSITLERKYESGGTGAAAVFLLAYSYRFTEVTGATNQPSRNATDLYIYFANGTTPVSLDTLFAQQVMSRIWCVSLNGSNQYFWLSLGTDSTRQATSILYRYAGDASVGAIPNWLPVATLTPDYASPASGIVSGPSSPPSVAQDVTFPGDTGESVYTIVGTFVAQSNSVALGMFEVDFASPQLWQSVELGKSAYLACGTPMIYDGSTLTEAGFVHAPPQPSITLSGGGGQVPINQALTYVVCYAQQDALGNVHRSAPSAPAIVVNPSIQTVTLNLIPYKATYRQPQGFGAASVHPVTIEVYRNTVANGSVYQLLAVVDNQFLRTTQTFVDQLSDAAIATNLVLYTQQGLVPAVGWPSLSALAVHADRILGCDADGITQYYSTPLEAGAAPRMADSFTLTWPEGPLTASWSLEGRLHAATARKIHFIYGDGPNDQGASSDFSQPQIWQSDLGVVDARGVCICQPGVLFLSEKGLYLETRAGEFQWIGERVQRTLAAAGDIVTSMVALDRFGSVRISLGGASSPVLHYDYRHDRWSTLLYAAGMVSGVSALGAWWGLSTVATLYQESSTSNLDGGAWVPTILTTGWALPGGQMQGWGEAVQAQMILSQSSPFGFSASFTRDYGGTAELGPVVWTDLVLSALTTQPLIQVRATIPMQTSEAMSVTLTDAAPSLPMGTGKGAVWKHLQIRTYPKEGEYQNLDYQGVQ